MLGLALEGGGAKGAFHIGVVKAFFEEGYTFDGITGTSIGALNGAIIAQGDFEKCYKLWESLEPYMLFDIEDEEYKKIISMSLDKEMLLKMALKLRKIIRNKGIDTSRMRSVIEGILDEDRLRASLVDFGLVTVSLSDFKPLELFKEEIPNGRMSDFLLASANLPVFDSKKIKDKLYLDGGFYDNCPINLLAKKGYKDIIAVRTKSIGINQKIKYPDLNLVQIIPSEDLGRLLDFNNEGIQKNIKLGYYDAQRYLKGLKGYKYYIEPLYEDSVFKMLAEWPDKAICDLGQILGISNLPSKRMLFEKIIPEIANTLKLNAVSYQDILIKLLEELAEEKGLYKYKIYSFNSFLNEIRSLPESNNLNINAGNIKLPLNYFKKASILNTARYIIDLIKI